MNWVQYKIIFEKYVLCIFWQLWEFIMQPFIYRQTLWKGFQTSLESPKSVKNWVQYRLIHFESTIVIHVSSHNTSFSLFDVSPWYFPTNSIVTTIRSNKLSYPPFTTLFSTALTFVITPPPLNYISDSAHYSRHTLSWIVPRVLNVPETDSDRNDDVKPSQFRVMDHLTSSPTQDPSLLAVPLVRILRELKWDVP